MILYPNAYFKKVQEITIEFLKKNKIKALVLSAFIHNYYFKYFFKNNPV